MVKKKVNEVYVPITKSFIRSGIIKIPNHMRGLCLAAEKAIITVQDESFEIPLVSTGYDAGIIGEDVKWLPSWFEVRLNAEARRFFEEYFCYSYALQKMKSCEFQESCLLSVQLVDGELQLNEIESVVYEGEMKDYIKSTYSKYSYIQTSENKEDGRNAFIGIRDLKPSLSKITPIEEINLHNHVSNCVYIWYSMPDKKVYVGSAKGLHVRMIQHLDTANKIRKGDKDGNPYNITHFAYLEFPFLPLPIVRRIEKIIIKAYALFFPNFSNGKHTIVPVNHDTEWQMINREYS